MAKVLMKVPYGYKNVEYCEAAVLLCLDFRFRHQTMQLIRDYFRVRAFDVHGLAGSASGLNGGCMASIKALKISHDIHKVDKFIVVHHEDCGAYGGSARFGNDRMAEEEFHREELLKARGLIVERFPGKEVILVYARLVDNQESIEFVLVE